MVVGFTFAFISFLISPYCPSLSILSTSLSPIIKASTRVLFHSHPIGRLEQVDAR